MKTLTSDSKFFCFKKNKQQGIFIIICLMLLTNFKSFAQHPIVYFTFDNDSTIPVTPQDSISGTNYMHSRFTSSLYNLKYGQTANEAESIVNGGVVGKYLLFEKAGNSSNKKSLITEIDTIIDSLASFTSFTVEFLAKFSDAFVAQKGADLFQFGNASAEFDISSSNSLPNLNFRGATGSGNVLNIGLDGINRKSVSYYLDKNWHHFAFIIRLDPDSELIQQIYIDGQTAFEFSDTMATVLPFLGNYDFAFNYGTPIARDFLGGMDELAIYDRFLTAGEVYRHYLDFRNHQHYTNATSPITPSHFSTAGVLDPLEFPKGYELGSEDYDSLPNAAIQIKNFPAPRFKPGHTLRRNVNFKSIAMADINTSTQTTPYRKTLIPIAVGIQNELAENWNYYYNFTENTSNFFTAQTNDTTFVNGAFIKDINTSGKNYPLAGILYRKQSDITRINAAPGKNYTTCTNIKNAGTNEQCLIACQDLESLNDTAPCTYPKYSIYPRDSTSATDTIITPNSTSPKSWSPLSRNRKMYADDGLTAIYNLDTMLNSYPLSNNLYLDSSSRERIKLLIENNEIAVRFSGGLYHNLTLDTAIMAELGAGDINVYQGIAKMHVDNDYRDTILTSDHLPLPDSIIFMNYAVDGHENPRHNWEYLRQTHSFIDGHPYPSTDIYTNLPQRWHVNQAGDKHGWRFLAISRYNEIYNDGHGHAYGDKRFAPFVSAGYDQRSEADMRPGQYLGLLKAVMLQGVDFFYSYTEKAGEAGRSFCWKMAPPAYAQAIGSRLEHFLQHGVSLFGDMPLNTDDVTAPTDSFPSFWFKSDDVQNLITVRQDYDSLTALDRYAIVGAKMKYSNDIGATPLNANATIKLNGENLTISIRRQGSTYIYDYTTSDTVFYQLDKWHQYEHPAWWSKDFELEAEVNDNTSTANWEIKSEGIARSGSDIDLTNVTSYVHFNTATPLTFIFQPRKDSVANEYAVWIRARSTSGSSGINLTLSSSLGIDTSRQLNNIDTAAWQWYEVTPGTFTYDSLSDNDIRYSLILTPQNANVEIDAIRLASPMYAPCTGTSFEVTNGSASQVSNYNYKGQSLSMKGIFMVDHNFTFDSCAVFMSPGAEIIVMPNDTLRIKGSAIKGCTQMWKGITVQELGVLIVDSSTISDAASGTYQQDQSSLYCSNVVFKNNYCGIQIGNSPVDGISSVPGSLSNTRFTSSPGNLLPPYPGQSQVPPSTRGYAGIIIPISDFNPSGVSTALPNVFDSLNIGIVSTGFLQVTNCRFADIKAPVGGEPFQGAAIASLRGRSRPELIVTGLGKTNDTATFHNCDMAVYAVGGLTVSDCKMTSINNAGIASSYAIWKDVTIHDNYIESKHSGIVLSINDGADTVNIFNNEMHIGMVDSVAGNDNAGIVAANFNNSADSKINIHDNNIYLYHSYYTGLWMMNTSDAVMVSNSIQQYNPSYPGLQNPAIKLDNTRYSVVNCNSINDANPDTTVIADNVGVEISMSTGTQIGCNSTDKTGDGFLFHSDCSGTNFTGNNMHNHNVGLHVSPTGRTGMQPDSSDNHRGNEWLGSYSQKGALNENTVNLTQSLFKYDLTANDSSFHPTFYPGTVSPPSGWFEPDTNRVEDSCSVTAGCEAFRIGCSDETIDDADRAIAENFLEIAAEYPNETHWIAERNLYTRLLRCPDLMIEDSIIISFFNSFSQYDSQRFYSELDLILSGANGYNSVIDSLLANNNSLIEILIAQYDSLLRIWEPMEEDDPLKQELAYLMMGNYQQQRVVYYNLEVIYQALEDERDMTVEELAVDNLAATFSEQYEQNEQAVNNIYFDGLIDGDREMIDEEVEIVQPIAEQCPYSGGPAVYKARALLIKKFGTISYNDRQICFEDSIAWRKKETEQISKLQLSIHPNPSSGAVMVFYQLASEESGELVLINILGDVIMRKPIKNNSAQQIIDVSVLNNGVYFLRVITTQGLSTQQKLVVTR